MIYEKQPALSFILGQYGQTIYQETITEATEVTGCRKLYIITAEHSEEIGLENGLSIHVLPAWRWLLGI